MLDFLAEAVTIRDRNGSIAYANRAALASMGFESMDDLQTRSSRSIMGDYVVQDEHGNPLTLEDVPSVRLMQGEPVDSLLMRTVNRETGELRWRHLKTAPLRDDEGELFAAVTVIEDVTAVKTAETRTRVLAESGRILASSLDYQETLQNVTNLAVGTLADWCVVDLVDAQLRREHVVIAHSDPTKVARAERMRELEPDEIDPDAALGRVLRTGASELHANVTDEQLQQGARNEEHLKLLRELDFRSVMLVPMSVPSRTIGVMTLVTAESRRRLDPDDLELAEQLARRAAVAVENARLHTRLTRIADTLQESLLPEALPEVPGWEMAALYRPAGAEQRIDVGGDFFEVFQTDAGWFVVIGDVTGKGVAAAALTALLRHGSRFASRYDPEPSAIMRELDASLHGRSSDSMCTALCMRLGADHVVISSGGHPPALVVSSDGTVKEEPEPGPLLGAFQDGQWPQRRLPISGAELWLLYTDGVTEAQGVNDRFGTARLKQLLAEHAGASPEELLEELDRALGEFTAGRPRQDDVAALALRARS